jgi:acetyl esterase/lipase
VQDAKAALRWIRSNASLYGVDTKHVAYWGVSAGGYLGAELGTSCGVKALEPEPEGTPSPDSGMAAISTDPAQSDCADAVALWFTPVDFPKMDSQALPNSQKHGTPESSEAQFLGCVPAKCPKALLDAANPTTYIDAKDPPFLLMHGDNDHRVPLQQSKDFYAALKAKGVEAQLIVVPGADHIWVGATPEQKKQILQQTFDFLDAHLKR